MHMDLKLYNAAIEGDIQPFKGSPIQLDLLVTPINNTILHLNISSQNKKKVSTKFVEEILCLCSSLLLQVNDKGETPLHVAAKWGHEAIVRALIKQAKAQHEDNVEIGRGAARTMMRMRNNEGNTALHEAVLHCSYPVVRLLTEEDPHFPYPANYYGETPLYIAVLRRSSVAVVEILNNCTSPTHGGPNGKTALHAAVIYHRKEITKKLLEKKKDLTREIDDYGWTPLHYAAYYGYSLIVKELLKVDVSAAYITENNRKMTPLHMAGSQGYMYTMKLIILHCPDCCELVDKWGWNVLHFAMASFATGIELKIVLQNQFLRKLIYAKDVNGNTPVHVLALTHEDSFFDIMNGKYIDGQLNKQNLTIGDLRILRCSSPQLLEEIEELYKPATIGPYSHGVIRRPDRLNKDLIRAIDKTRESHLLVAVLIATVTFAAAFTLPGGYKSDKEDEHRGTAILTKSSAFQAFVIADAIAMIFSLSAVFFHFTMAGKIFRKYLILFNLAYTFTIVAMVAMVLAFITGTYAVLSSPSIGLAIVTCLIGLIFLLIVFLIVYWVISIYFRNFKIYLQRFR